jgi:hypothetical protein
VGLEVDCARVWSVPKKIKHILDKRIVGFPVDIELAYPFFRNVSF